MLRCLVRCWRISENWLVFWHFLYTLWNGCYFFFVYSNFAASFFLRVLLISQRWIGYRFFVKQVPSPYLNQWCPRWETRFPSNMCTERAWSSHFTDVFFLFIKAKIKPIIELLSLLITVLRTRAPFQYKDRLSRYKMRMLKTRPGPVFYLVQP